MKFEPFSFISTEFDQHDENVKIISREAGGKTCTSVSYLLRKTFLQLQTLYLGNAISQRVMALCWKFRILFNNQRHFEDLTLSRTKQYGDKCFLMSASDVPPPPPPPPPFFFYFKFHTDVHSTRRFSR